MSSVDTVKRVPQSARRERRRFSGFSLLEVMIVMSMTVVILLIINRPLSVLLNYPKKTVHERTDRVAGRLSYSKLDQELKNAVSGQVWSTVSSDNKTFLLIPLLIRFDDADSDGHWDYALWVHDPVAHTLSHKRWTQAELSQRSMPSPRQEPTQDEWAAYFSAPVIVEANHVQDFRFEPPASSATSYQVTFKVKNPSREGSEDEYVLRGQVSL